MKHFLLIVGLAVLSGCTFYLREAQKLNEQCDKELRYCLDFQNIMNGRAWTDNWTDTVGEPTDHTLSNGLNSSDEGYIRIDISSHSSCPLTPRHMPTMDKTNVGSWGKVIFVYTWDSAPGENEVYCRPVDTASAYAFCAEKDGKAVAICIQQMTDNEEMAREIFESFRWTD